MTALYELAVLGSPTDEQIAELRQIIEGAVSIFGLRLGHEVGWSVLPEKFEPDQKKCSAAIFFGGIDAPEANIGKILERGIPLLPVVSDVRRVGEEIPKLLLPLNCLAYNEGGRSDRRPLC